MNITAASKKLGIGMQYTRKLITSGRIPSKLVPVSEGSATQRHEISEADLEAFLKEPRKSVAPRRTDGRQRFIVYATTEELAAITKAAPGAVIEKQKSQSVVLKAKLSKMTNAMVEDEIKALIALPERNKSQAKRLTALKAVRSSRVEKATK